MTFFLNLLPKIKVFAKALIIMGNFVLELYDMVRVTFANSSAATAA